MSSVATPPVRILGAGRAGTSFAWALRSAGWQVDVWDHDRTARQPERATEEVELVLLCVPDPQVATLAARLVPSPDIVIAHCAGSLGLDVLAPHPRVASLHPLVSLTGGEPGGLALRGAWFAVAGGEEEQGAVRAVVRTLDGHTIVVPDESRVRYHAAAVVASNHLVALMGQVERLAAAAGVPPEAFLELAKGSLCNVERLGARDALTGPVSRGDWDTVARHLEAIDVAERPLYEALARAAATLSGSTAPEPPAPKG